MFYGVWLCIALWRFIGLHVKLDYPLLDVWGVIMLVISQDMPAVGISPGVLNWSRLSLPGSYLGNIALVCVPVDLVKKYGLVGYKGLMAAVIYQAQVDAKGGNMAAVDWLISDEAAEYCQAIQFNHAIVMSWTKGY